MEDKPRRKTAVEQIAIAAILAIAIATGMEALTEIPLRQNLGNELERVKTALFANGPILPEMICTGQPYVLKGKSGAFLCRFVWLDPPQRNSRLITISYFPRPEVRGDGRVVVDEKSPTAMIADRDGQVVFKRY